MLQSTLILLPAEEKIATVFGGGTVDWVFDDGHVASASSASADMVNTSTDIHIISDHGNEYTFQLQEISNDATPILIQSLHHSCQSLFPPPSWSLDFNRFGMTTGSLTCADIPGDSGAV